MVDVNMEPDVEPQLNQPEENVPIQNVEARPRVIGFTTYRPDTWLKVYDLHHQEINFQMNAAFDSGFDRYSFIDDAFKRTDKRFQITAHISNPSANEAALVEVNGVTKSITQMQIHICGVESATQSTVIPISQQQSRGPVLKKPVSLNALSPNQTTNITVPRLCFAHGSFSHLERSDKHRLLVLVRLLAVTDDGEAHLIQVLASDRIIISTKIPPVVAERPVVRHILAARRACGNPALHPVCFTRYFENTWLKLHDANQNELDFTMSAVIDAGFNYSPRDGTFVNQKKHHFQVSVNLEAIEDNPAAFVRVGTQFKPIQQIQLAFCGVKTEDHTEVIEIKQKLAGNTPGAHRPVVLDMIPPRQITKVTVPRLHFSEPTMHNHRINNDVNPNQKYFLLLVRLIAVADDGTSHLVLAYASDRVIVRSTNYAD